eukprot:3092548-Rhodomonas_salina.1
MEKRQRESTERKLREKEQESNERARREKRKRREIVEKEYTHTKTRAWRELPHTTMLRPTQTNGADASTDREETECGQSRER